MGNNILILCSLEQPPCGQKSCGELSTKKHALYSGTWGSCRDDEVYHPTFQGCGFSWIRILSSSKGLLQECFTPVGSPERMILTRGGPHASEGMDGNFMSQQHSARAQQSCDKPRTDAASRTHDRSLCVCLSVCPPVLPSAPNSC